MHASLARVLAAFPYLAQKYFTFGSFGSSAAVGGIVTLWPRLGLQGNGADNGFSSRTLGCPGRVLRVVLEHSGGKFIHWNVHLEKLNSEEAARVVSLLIHDIDLVKGDPLHRLLVFGGDLNCGAFGALRHFVADPLSPRDCAPPPRAHAEVFSALAQLTEISGDAPTHYYGNDGSMTPIDRVFTSMPPWILRSVFSRYLVLNDPLEVWRNKISDHAPICWRISVRLPLPKDMRSFPLYVYRLPEFKEFHDALVADAQLHTYDPATRRDVHKDLLLEAARLAADFDFKSVSLSAAAIAQTLAAVSRAVWQDDICLARSLVGKSGLAAEHLVICGNGVPLSCPEPVSSRVQSCADQC